MKATRVFFTFLLAVLCSGLSLHAARDYADQNLGYTVHLPDNWVVDATDPSKHLFYDSTGTASGLLSIARYQRNATDFPTSREWTQAYFIAYIVAVDYSIDPWGTVLYLDSSDASTQNSLWAPEAYSRFYSLDTTLGTWDEYLRYTAAGSYGYELAALSDTADMAANIGLYAALLQSVSLPGDDEVSVKRLAPARVGAARRAFSPRTLVDPLGRRFVTVPHAGSRKAAGVVLGRDRKKRTTLP
jgi:hypothetical protein